MIYEGNRIVVVCGQQGNIEGFCVVVLWYACALPPAVVPLRHLEKKITVTFQRYVVLDAQGNRQGLFKVSRKLQA